MNISYRLTVIMCNDVTVTATAFSWFVTQNVTYFIASCY